MDFFEWIERFMTETGCDLDTAAREYHAVNDPDYDPEDYDRE